MPFSVELLNCKFSTFKSLKFFIYEFKTLLICWIDHFPLEKTWNISCISSKRCWIVELPNIQWQKLFKTCRRTLSGKSNMRHSPLKFWIANFQLSKAWNFLYISSKRCWFVELQFFHWQKLCNKCGLAKILTCAILCWIVELQIFHWQKLEIFYIRVQNAVDLLNW